jgi:hypothetical protein
MGRHKSVLVIDQIFSLSAKTFAIAFLASIRGLLAPVVASGLTGVMVPK